MGSKKKKKTKKKKDSLFMTDEEREEEEEAKKKVQQERLEKDRLMKELEEELRKAKLEKKEQDNVAMKQDKLRNEVLQKHCSEFKAFDDEHLNYLFGKRRESEWQTYITCNHRPFPNDPPALNSFLYTWKMIQNKLNMNNILKEIEIIFETILPAQEYINLPLDLKESTVNNLIEAKLNYYKEIQRLVDKTTFDTVMDILKDHETLSSSEIEILKSSKNFSFWLWSWALSKRTDKVPAHRRPSRKTPTMLVTLPENMDLNRYHLRIFYTSYDPYSFQTATYHSQSYPSNRNLYEETLDLRKLEVNALKTQYANNYDEDIMPWWFLLDEEILAEKRRKEEKKKEKKKKKVIDNGIPDSMMDVDTVTTDTVTSAKASSGTLQTKSQVEEFSEHKEVPTAAAEYHEENEVGDELKQPRATKILYSRSMTELLEAKRKECNGPVYYSEVDPINFLEESDADDLPSDTSLERDRKLFRSEKHTTFRACYQTDTVNIIDPEIMKNYSKYLNEGEGPDEKLCFTTKREFLDWKSDGDVSPDSEAALQSLEEFLFGDSYKVVENGKITYVRRNPELRSIKELMKDIVPRKSTASLNMEPEVRKYVEEFLNVQNVPKPLSKITNVTEMKELEMEISNVLDLAWQEFSNDCITKLFVPSGPSEINMRQYTILGGVYQFDFFEEEPQPFVNKDKFKVQLHYGEYKLRKVVFDRIPQIRVDLSTEVEKKLSEAKRQKSMTRKPSRYTYSSLDMADNEPDISQTDDDLVWLAVKLPINIIFFESPSPVRWNETKKYWTTDDTYDSKWNAKTNVLKFKLGKTGPFAITSFRFSCLPYYNFRLRPSLDWKKNPFITLELNTRNFPITFEVKEDKVTITKLVHEKTLQVSHIIGVPFTIEDLIAALRSAGIDIFPDWDSFLYVNATLRKMKSLEEHMYYSIGMSSPAYEYTESYHNAMAREDRIYFKMRECIDKNGQVETYRTILAEPRKTSTVITDSYGFVKEEPGNLGAGYAPDFKYLLIAIASKKALHRMKKASKCTVSTVINLIKSTKILSYT